MRVLKQLFGDGMRNGMGTNMAYVTTEVEVEVDLSEFDDETLIEELESRGLNALGHFDDLDLIDELHTRGFHIDNEDCLHIDNEDFEIVKNFLDVIWQKKRNGLDYSQDLDDLIYCGIGKIL